MKKSNPQMENTDKIEELLKAGSEISGGIAGGVIGFITGGPVGAAIGGASQPIIAKIVKKVSTEIKKRLIGPREEIRMGATLTYAVDKIQKKLKMGQQIRSDGFFSNDLNVRSSAEEIIEGVLLVAQKEHEEKKIIYFGNLIANIAFDTQFDKGESNYLIKLAETLTYRQLCLISIFAQKQRFPLSNNNFYGRSRIGTDLFILLHEIFELYNLGMLNCSGAALIELGYIVPRKMVSQGAGAHLYNLMELHLIDLQDLNNIEAILKK